MHSITVCSHVAASPKKVWKIIGDPSRISAWHPAIETSTLDGADRMCTLGNGAEISERIEQIDSKGRNYTYTITESPLPLSSYRSTIKTEAEGKGSVVVWTADFEPEGASAEDVASMLTDVYQAGLAALRQEFSS